MKKFLLAFWAFVTVYRSNKDSIGYLEEWYHGPEELKKSWERLLLMFVKTSTWELDNNRIGTFEQAVIRLEESKKGYDRSVDQYKYDSENIRNLENRLRADITRFEQEVIHLKSLVEEKNMVIDKLHADQKALRSV